MSARRLFFAMAFTSALYQYSQAADEPSKLIVGRWKIREQANDISEPKTTEMFEFSTDGKGKVSKATEKKTESGVISWTIRATYGNACIIKINYDEAPKEVKPLVLLLVFDGSDTVVFQARVDRIIFMDRQTAP